VPLSLRSAASTVVGKQAHSPGAWLAFIVFSCWQQSWWKLYVLPLNHFLLFRSQQNSAIYFTDASTFLGNHPTCDQTANRRHVKSIMVLTTYVWHE